MDITLSYVEISSVIVTIFTVGLSIGTFKAKYVSTLECKNLRSEIDTKIQITYDKFYNSLVRVHDKIDKIEQLIQNMESKKNV